MEWVTKFNDGRMQRNTAKSIADYVASCKDGSYIIKIDRQKKSRSNQQNRYLHQMFTIFSHELISYTGDKQYTMEVVKDICKCKFLKTSVINEKTGEVIGERIKGTSELTTTEMMVFVDDIIQWSLEQFGIRLYLPNEQSELL
jgi:hypothetical protein